VLDALNGIQLDLTERHRWLPPALGRLLRGSKGPVRGLYIWGPVGRGKTFLMDLFFDSLDIREKRRLHFHHLMRDIHERLAALRGTPDPVNTVAADIARSTRVLCFDEFFVSDIADAMLLGRLLDGLFSRGVTLVTTSNVAPDDLYRDGLQRQKFLPAIALLKTHMRVLRIADGQDYRLRFLQRSGTYHFPADENADAHMRQYFSNISPAHCETDTVLNVLGRDIPVRYLGEGIAWFDFAAMCDGPRSQNDYIEIARSFPTVIIANVPLLNEQLNDQARRFIALIDEFYDRRVKLVVSAAAPVEQLFQSRRLQPEFGRTRSRLTEMQSRHYLGAPHLG
jgi:cell division protein ZapE